MVFGEWRRSWRGWAGIIGLALAGGVGSGAAQTLDYLPTWERARVAELYPTAEVLEGGIRFLVQQEGEGPAIKPGDVVTALYVGKFLDGRVFNQKQQRWHNFRFRVGATPREVIEGWERVLSRMRLGGVYTVVIPAKYGYGSEGRPGQVPPYATLDFKIEIIGHEAGPDR